MKNTFRNCRNLFLLQLVAFPQQDMDFQPARYKYWSIRLKKNMQNYRNKMVNPLKKNKEWNKKEKIRLQNVALRY